MDRKYYAELYYGYQETEEGIFHAFNLEDLDNLPDANHAAAKLAGLLDTTTKDERFNWDCMDVQLPDGLVAHIQQQAVRKAISATKPQPKEYTLESFRKAHKETPITASGWVASTDVDRCINSSSILTKLIQVAGRLVDRFASDLWLGWREITRDLEAACTRIFLKEGLPTDFAKSYLFGFREEGVDDESFVLSRYNNAGTYNNSFGAAYREIWRCDVCVSCEGKITMSLYKVTKEV